MIALLEDAAIFQNQDQIRISDGGQPVGDDKAGAVLVSWPMDFGTRQL